MVRTLEGGDRAKEKHSYPIEIYVSPKTIQEGREGSKH